MGSGIFSGALSVATLYAFFLDYLREVFDSLNVKGKNNTAKINALQAFFRRQLAFKNTICRFFPLLDQLANVFIK